MEKIIMFLGLSIFGMMVTNYAGIALIAAIALFVFLAIAHEWMQEQKRKREREEVFETLKFDHYWEYLPSPEGFRCQDCGAVPGQSCVDVVGHGLAGYHYSRLNKFHNSREDSCEE